MKQKWLKYVAVFIIAGVVIGMYYPDKIFLAFISTWLFIIPAVAVIYMTYGLQKYIKDRKNDIVVSLKPSEAMTRLMSIIRQEEELKKEKDILCKQFRGDMNNVNGIKNGTKGNHG